jgi:hypothetical protein
MLSIAPFDKKLRVHPKKFVHHFLGHRSYSLIDFVDVPFSLRLLGQTLDNNIRQV